MKSHLISLFVLGLLMFAHAQDDMDRSSSSTVKTTTHVVTSTTKKSTTATTKPTSTTAKTTSHKTTHSTTTEPTTTTHQDTTTTAARTTTHANISTTTKMLTTTTPKPTGPPIFNLTKGNMTCLLLQAKITVAFNYTSAAGKAAKANNSITREAETTGECGDSMERLSIRWVHGNLTERLELSFTKTSTDSSLTNITFEYTDMSNLPNVTSGNWSSTTSLLSTQLGTSYNCTKGVTVTVGQMKLEMDDLQVGAFMQDESDSPSFQKTGSDCAYDGKTDAIVPIAVGCALAAMVLIVLVGYCIGRRRSAANNYQSMNNA